MNVHAINSSIFFAGLNVSKQVMKKILKSPKEQKYNALREIDITNDILSKIPEDVCVFKPTKKNVVFIRAEENYFHSQKETKVKAKNFIKNPSKYIFGLLTK